MEKRFITGELGLGERVEVLRSLPHDYRDPVRRVIWAIYGNRVPSRYGFTRSPVTCADIYPAKFERCIREII